MQRGGGLRHCIGWHVVERELIVEGVLGFGAFREGLLSSTPMPLTSMSLIVRLGGLVGIDKWRCKYSRASVVPR